LIEAIVDSARLDTDPAYREEIRFRFETDHFFAAAAMGFNQFNRKLHGPAVDLFFPKNRSLPIEEQDPIHSRMHLDPRKTFKTTLGLVDTAQWFAAHSERLTALYETATQPLAAGMMEVTVQHFGRGILGRLYPEIGFNKRKREDCYDCSTRRDPSIDPSIGYTSPKTAQAGWHPLLLNNDDVVDAINSGKHATDDVRKALISVCTTNKNTLRAGGYFNIRGTRYHPEDYYGHELETLNPKKWKVLIRASVKVISGEALVRGEFPAEEDLICNFAELPEMDYDSLRDLFMAEFETFMCFRAGCRVLMADWTERPIEQIKIGDEVIGFERTARYAIKLRKTTVSKIFTRRAEVARVTTDSGRVTHPTFDHRFLRPPNGGELQYRPLKVGTKMVSVYTPSQPCEREGQRDFDWLGGMFDGEGSISRAGTVIYQKQTENPEVHAELLRVLQRLGISHGMGMTHTTDRFALGGGRSFLIRLLQNARMAKQGRILATLWGASQISETTGRAGGGRHPIVAAMESMGEEQVYDFETGTHNFVCDGFAVHNCQQQNDPIGASVSKFPEKMWQASLYPVDKIPAIGDGTYVCWRLPYGGKPYMVDQAEGAAARIVGGKVFVLDTWQGSYAPSGLGEKIVKTLKLHEPDALIIEEMPGSEYMGSIIRTEMLRRNVSTRVEWVPFEEDDHVRAQAILNLEPIMKAGRLLMSQGMTNMKECHRQFTRFGMIGQNGIIDAIRRIAENSHISLIRAQMTEEEILWQQQLREEQQWNQIFEQQGVPLIDEEAKRIAQASMMAMESAVTSNGLPPLPGGLDG
jgi:hypothetical protein